MAAVPVANAVPHFIRRYKNRRMYSTLWARYVRYQEVLELVRNCHAVVIYEYPGQRDITLPVLADILAWELWTLLGHEGNPVTHSDIVALLKKSEVT